MSSEEYWREREKKWQEQSIKDDTVRKQEISRRLFSLNDEIEKEIAKQWENFAKRGEISMSEAKKKVREMDVKAFERKAKEMVKNKDFSPEANEKLRVYNATMRINRLELLKSTIGLETLDAFNDFEKYMKGELEHEANEEYERQAGILGLTMQEVPLGKLIEQVVDSSFRVTGFPTFSDNLWSYQEELKNNLDTLLTKGIIQGKNPRALAPSLRELLTEQGKLNTRYNTERLMITELTRVQVGIQEQSYKDADIDKYGYTAEPSACDICKEVEKNGPYLVKDMEPGTNAPNMHPFCKCSTYPYVDREAIMKDFDDRGLTAEKDTNKDTSENDYYDPKKPWTPDELMKGTNLGKAMTAKQADEHNANPLYQGGEKNRKLIEKYRKKIDKTFKNYQTADKTYQEARKKYEATSEVVANLDKAIAEHNKTVKEYRKLQNKINKQYEVYSINCQRCAPTYELRRRGYDVTALPNPESTWIETYGIPQNMWRDKDGNVSEPEMLKARSTETVTKELLNKMETGERGTIDWAWPRSNSGHIINVERTKDGIVFVDAQTGRQADSFEEYMQGNSFKKSHYGRKSGVNYNRVDDKYIDLDNIEKIVKGE